MQHGTSAHTRTDHPQAPRRRFTIADVWTYLEMSEATWHRWRSQCGDIKSDDAKRLKAKRFKELE